MTKAREPRLTERMLAARRLLHKEGFSNYQVPYQMRILGFGLTGNGARDLRPLTLVRDELTALSLETCPIDDDQLAVLEGFPVLHHLDLTGTRVGDAGVAHLARLPALETLVLIRTRVTDASAATLATIPTLAHLDLSDTAISYRTFEALAGAPSLRVLRARQTRVGAAGVLAVDGAPALERVVIGLGWRERRRVAARVAPIVVE